MNALAQEIHKNAVAHGWWDGAERKLPEILMLIVSELAEALEEYRNGRPMLYHECNALKEPCATTGEGAERECKQFAGLEDDCVEWNPKPEGIAIELADAVIRILDYCGKANIDIEDAIRMKHEYNTTRPYRHGGKAC
ncbi:MAG: hypothetical protein GX418_12085 [Clostridiales bacterium]|nr:hypothetical protein [Clostridiales bacterium]